MNCMSMMQLMVVAEDDFYSLHLFDMILMEMSGVECAATEFTVGRECWNEVNSMHSYYSKSVEKCEGDPFPSKESVLQIPAKSFLEQFKSKIWIKPEITDGIMRCSSYNPIQGKVTDPSEFACQSKVHANNAICVRKSRDIWPPSLIRNFQVDSINQSYYLLWDASQGKGFTDNLAFLKADNEQQA